MSTITGITAKDASNIAKEYYEDIAPDEKHRLTLEEIELSSDGKFWLITLGVYTPSTSLMLISQGIKEALSYKVFKIRRKGGDVFSMKMKPYPLASTPGK